MHHRGSSCYLELSNVKTQLEAMKLTDKLGCFIRVTSSSGGGGGPLILPFCCRPILQLQRKRLCKLQLLVTVTQKSAAAAADGRELHARGASCARLLQESQSNKSVLQSEEQHSYCTHLLCFGSVFIPPTSPNNTQKLKGASD